MGQGKAYRKESKCMSALVRLWELRLKQVKWMLGMQQASVSSPYKLSRRDDATRHTCCNAAVPRQELSLGP
jgi:hypothetical protein